jgi:hypothetical protein
MMPDIDGVLQTGWATKGKSGVDKFGGLRVMLLQG